MSQADRKIRVNSVCLHEKAFHIENFFLLMNYRGNYYTRYNFHLNTTKILVSYFCIATNYLVTLALKQKLQ